MKSWIYVVAVFVFLLLYTVINAALKKKKPFKRASLTMIFGLVVMFCVNIAGKFTGVYLPVSPLSLTVASCFGVSGVAAMLFVNLGL